MALDTCSSGHNEICFEYNDGCPVCELHSVFNLGRNSDVSDERYKKCDTHDCYHQINEDCPGCRDPDDIIGDIYDTCSTHDCWYDGKCPACEVEEDKSKDLEDLQDECSKLQEEVDRLKGTITKTKSEPKQVKKTRGYEFF